MKVYVLTAVTKDSHGDRRTEIITVCMSKTRAEKEAKDYWEPEIQEHELIEGDD
jgi:hypothetical protein